MLACIFIYSYSVTSGDFTYYYNLCGAAVSYGGCDENSAVSSIISMHSLYGMNYIVDPVSVYSTQCALSVYRFVKSVMSMKINSITLEASTMKRL